MSVAREDRTLTWLVVSAVAAMLLWMLRPLFAGTVPFTGDLLHFHYILRDFYARALEAGQRFDWMPSLYSGFYVVGEGQLGAYHPLHWLLYRLLPLDRAFAIEVVAAYPFVLAGMVLFLRRWCHLAAAVFGAMLFAFCGFTLSHGVHPNMVGVVAHAPWVLWAIDRTLQSPDWRGRAAGGATIGLLTGSQLLLGHPQAVWMLGLIAVSYAAAMLMMQPVRQRTPGAATVAGGLLLGVAIGAVQLLATWHALAGSVRATVDDTFASTYALAPAHLLQLLAPYAFWGRILRWSETPAAGDEYAAYGGAVALTLAVWWLGASWARRRQGAATAVDRLGAYAASLGAIGLWLATGSWGKLYMLQTWLPIVGRFRVPARFILFTDLAIAILAALALRDLLQPRSPENDGGRRGVFWTWATAVAATLAALWLMARGDTPQSSTMVLAIAAGPVLFIVAAGLLALAVRGRRWAAIGLVLFAACDQALYGLGGVVAWHDYLTRREAEQLVAEQDVMPPGGGRMAHGGFPNLYVLAGYRVLDGYLGLTPARMLDYRSPQALRVAQVAYANTRFEVSAPLQPIAGNEWFAAPDPLPRVRLVTAARPSRRPADDLKNLDIERAALTTHPMDLPGGPAGTAALEAEAPGAIEIATDAPTRQLLVVSESYDDGWIATVDGQRVTTERVNGDFVGCPVPAGRHRVRLDFAPAHLAIGKAISLGGFGLAMTLLAASRWTRRVKP